MLIRGCSWRKKKFSGLLVTNGYDERKIAQLKNFKRQNEGTTNENHYKKVPLFLQHLSESSNRRMDETIKKYNLNVKLISKPAPQLGQILRNKNKTISTGHNYSICKLTNKT